METHQEKSSGKYSRTMGRWVGIGLALGAGAGVALDNIPVGIGAGLAIGAAIGRLQALKDEKDEDNHSKS